MKYNVKIVFMKAVYGHVIWVYVTQVGSTSKILY